MRVPAGIARAMASRRTFAAIAILAGAIAAASLTLFEPLRAALSCLLGWTMLAIAISDAEDFIIPDALSLPAIPAGLIAARLLETQISDQSLMLDHFLAAVAGFVGLYAIKQGYFWWRKREGLGLGDVKLAAAAGAWTGLEGLSHVLLLACVLAMSYLAVLHVRDPRSVSGTAAVPFGVFLGPSIWLIWCADVLAAASGL